ncbi:cobalamin biosynthesis protein CobD [Sulfurimonas sp. SAG-AH-194-I05]|nr:adenosylcobinamide-phosphate synthase CbiB [Sulfurimonas sp. SAG-AH-194-I05]MDF1875332.1 cobalamin biosynthesis protein CobD [Sulfurimonas sp. SAG-AH-194-I05]
MSTIFITIIAYVIDKIFGEFRFIKHPVIYIGELITFFEKRYYKKTVLRGAYLVLFVLVSTGFISLLIEEFLSYFYTFLDIFISAIIASTLIAHKMLKDAVRNVLYSQDQQQTLSMLVSRDTQDLSESDIYKASIETYAENLSDGVIAPMFYLLLFGLPGIAIYKAINTMDSMVGYRTPTYEKYGKAAAKLDDVVNYIPSRLTAVLIMFIAGKKDLFAFYKNGKKHESPNAGHPITAMALALGIKLGGNTRYFGKMKKKPIFGKGRKIITQEDVLNALNLGKIKL